MKSGIYRILSLATNQYYYGSSNNLKRRFNEHKYLWIRNKGNYKLRNLLSKYGLENFKFEILEYCDVTEFEEKEKKYIEGDPLNLNVWINPFSSYGAKLGDNVKAKHYKGRPQTEEHKKRQSEKMKEYWKTHTPHWKGKSLPKEMRKKISDTLKKRKGGSHRV